MPLITRVESEDKQVRIRMNAAVYKEIEAYVKWANLSSPSVFLEEAALFVLRKDKEWKAYKNKHNK